MWAWAREAQCTILVMAHYPVPIPEWGGKGGWVVVGVLHCPHSIWSPQRPDLSAHQKLVPRGKHRAETLRFGIHDLKGAFGHDRRRLESIPMIPQKGAIGEAQGTRCLQ